MANFVVASLTQLAETPPPSPMQLNPEGPGEDMEARAAFTARLVEDVRRHMPPASQDGQAFVDVHPEGPGDDMEARAAFTARLVEAVRRHMPPASQDGQAFVDVQSTGAGVVAQEQEGVDAALPAETEKVSNEHPLKKPKDFGGSQRAWERLHGKFKPLSKKSQMLKDARRGGR